MSYCHAIANKQSAEIRLVNKTSPDINIGNPSITPNLLLYEICGLSGGENSDCDLE
jgi:hypothetical protein